MCMLLLNISLLNFFQLMAFNLYTICTIFCTNDIATQILIYKESDFYAVTQFC